MRDPIHSPTRFVELTKPLADSLSLSTLPYHAHEIALGFLCYHFVLYFLSPTLSRLACPKIYNGFDKRTRLNWDIHWVSMVQALFINTAALYVIFSDDLRREMNWEGRLWGYTPASGMVQGFAAGTYHARNPSFLSKPCQHLLRLFPLGLASLVAVSINYRRRRTGACNRCFGSDMHRLCEFGPPGMLAHC